MAAFTPFCTTKYSVHPEVDAEDGEADSGALVDGASVTVADFFSCVGAVVSPEPAKTARGMAQCGATACRSFAALATGTTTWAAWRGARNTIRWAQSP